MIMNNFKEVYKKANDEILGDKSILQRPKKHINIKPFLASAVAAAICITAVGILPGITGDVTNEQTDDISPTVVSELPVEKARNMPAYFVEDNVNTLECVEVSGEILTVEDAEKNIITYKITPKTDVFDAFSQKISLSEIKKGDFLTVEADENYNALKIILK